MQSLTRILGSWGPLAQRPSGSELLHSSLGAALGLALSGLLVWIGAAGGLLFLFAPLGASAVLVFAVPNSPLAQPWPAIMGNTLSALWALLLLGALPALPSPWPEAFAVGGAIAVMLLCRALHPPGGAMALLVVLRAPTLVPLGWHLVATVFLLTLALVLAGLAYHRATRRTYPLRHTPPAQARTPAAGRLALSNDDLTALLTRFDQSYNLSPDDLGALLAAAEEQAIQRRFAAVTCGEVMSAKLLTVAPTDSLETVADLFHRHLVKSLPVVGPQGELLGLLLRSDLFDWLWEGHRRSRWRQLLRVRPPAATVDRLMRAPEIRVQEATPLGELLGTLAQHRVQFIPVLRGTQLAGLITRTDVIRALLALR
ncbi:HPP family protein [Pantoea sp. 18069]|uniref:HPP family protein n=1 Tax=Pantoea sp. 18069 TaxID=2681415 RepID=UPI001358D8D3|nr:HPP family protein [Pantoea sp. 18069]